MIQYNYTFLHVKPMKLKIHLQKLTNSFRKHSKPKGNTTNADTEGKVREM